jgi:hypothetical protein
MKYSTADIVRLFDISRTTLFRWEQEGKIYIPVERVWKGAYEKRQYGDNHVDIIVDLLTGPWEKRLQGGDESVKEVLYRTLFLGKGSRLEGYNGLSTLPLLSEETIQKIIGEALMAQPGDEFRTMAFTLALKNETTLNDSPP